MVLRVWTRLHTTLFCLCSIRGRPPRPFLCLASWLAGCWRSSPSGPAAAPPSETDLSSTQNSIKPLISSAWSTKKAEVSKTAGLNLEDDLPSSAYVKSGDAHWSFKHLRQNTVLQSCIVLYKSPKHTSNKELSLRSLAEVSFLTCFE